MAQGADELTGRDLPSLSPADLGRLYLRESSFEAPEAGSYRGAFLQRIAGRGPLARILGAAICLPFRRLAFGLNLRGNSGVWYFLHPALTIGRFTPRIQPSVWRNTTALALDYSASRLPSPVRSLLYDEIKPVAKGLLLGIGGFGPPGRRLELFLFSLEKTG